MATVPRAWVDGYADSLEMISEEMRRRLAADLARVDYTAPVAEVRELLVQIMQAYCYESRSMAAQAAAEFYDGLREFQTGERMGAVAIDGYDPERVERRVRSAVEPLAEAQRSVGESRPFAVVPEGEFWADAGTAAERNREEVRRAGRELARALADYQGWSIKDAAGGTVFGNRARDGGRPRFARVPRGSESYPGGCPFCQMLASRGFKYRSELAAGGLDPDHYHSDCQCMVVPAWGKGSVEGYDPRAYDKGYEEWLDQDHSEHDAHVAATQRNRYDAQGRLKSGDGNRVDEKGALTDEQRALIRSKRTAAGNETRKANRSRMFHELGVSENEWKAMSEAEQRALLKKGNREPVREIRPKTRAEIFLGNLRDMLVDNKLYASAYGGAEWAAVIGEKERGLEEWVQRGYPSTRDRHGKQAILVFTSDGDVVVGAYALAHVDFDHPDERGRPDVTIRGIIDSLEYRIGRTGVEYDEDGKPSYRSVGYSVTTAVNPFTHEMVTAWRTKDSDFEAVTPKTRHGRKSKKR